MISELKYLQNNKDLTKYFKNILWLFAERILRITNGLFLAMWMAKYLGFSKNKKKLFRYINIFSRLFK